MLFYSAGSYYDAIKDTTSNFEHITGANDHSFWLSTLFIWHDVLWIAAEKENTSLWVTKNQTKTNPEDQRVK